jgi:hypothetical protein
VAEKSETGVTAAAEQARAAGVPESTLNRILTLSVDYRLSATETRAFLEVTRVAKVDNLPLEPLLDKIEEGLAKRIAVKNIVEVLEQKIHDYRFVERLLLSRKVPTTEEAVSAQHLNIFVDSLSAGVSRQELERFIQLAPAVPTPMLAIAVENLALLKQLDFDGAYTNEILLSGLRLESFSPSWRYLARVIVAARNKGVPDRKITDTAIEALHDKRDLREFMTMLGFTGRDLRHGPAVRRSE